MQIPKLLIKTLKKFHKVIRQKRGKDSSFHVPYCVQKFSANTCVCAFYLIFGAPIWNWHTFLGYVFRTHMLKKHDFYGVIVCRYCTLWEKAYLGIFYKSYDNLQEMVTDVNICK